MISSHSSKNTSKKSTLLNDAIPPLPLFTDLEATLQPFQENDFLKLPIRKRFRKINHTLCNLIQAVPQPTFLLKAVLEYLHRINQMQILNEPLTFSTFEFWLNHFSELSQEENYLIRAKISGKHIPREDYQAYFPIGMNRVLNGTHFVAAHLSPDVDTMIASFFGWIDAFAARVGSSLHQWLLPEGPPDSPITAMMREMFGPELYKLLPRTTSSLTLNARDLVTQRNWIKATGETLIGNFTSSQIDKAITLVDAHGCYLGDWRSQDFEQVRQVAVLFKSLLRWFENHFYAKVVSLFAQPSLTAANLPEFVSTLFDYSLESSEPVLEFNDKQKEQLNCLLQNILGVSNGLKGTIGDLISAFERLHIIQMSLFRREVLGLKESPLFDSQGQLNNDRAILFHTFEKLIDKLNQAMENSYNYVERLDIALAIKHQVLGISAVYLTLHSDVEEIRKVMENVDFLTVVIHEQDSSLFPIGIIRQSDIRKTGLGTVSLRDFCNLEETKMASYLEVVSVIDHHKSSLKTTSPPCIILGDVQSCNVLTAEIAFLINDRYSSGGMSQKQIEEQIATLRLHANTPSQWRILQQLFTRKQAHQQTQGFYIHPQREAIEYTLFLQAILDDTDLLSKVSYRDVTCIVKLINRLKSLQGKETEAITLDDFPLDKNFAKAAAKRILQNSDMYALYKKVFDFREDEISTSLETCEKAHTSPLFIDTKEQNGCARVGQTKIFYSNYASFDHNALAIRQAWLESAQTAYHLKPEIDLHMHMLSTIPSADEVYKNQANVHKHQDEIWFWIPSAQQARDHLATFLSNFQSVAKSLQEEMTVEFLGSNSKELEALFQRYFLPVRYLFDKSSEKGLPIAILRYKAGAINSRKAMITPYLPRLIP